MTMFESLLVPVDDTRESERALPVAVAVAQRTGAGIELLTVDNPNTDTDEMVLYQRMLLDRFPDGVRGTSHVALGDEPVAEQVIEEYRRRPTSLLTLATRAPGSLWTWLTGGSVGEDVVAEVLGPVLLVGPGCDAEVAGQRVSNRTIVALDGTALDGEVFAAGAGWAQAVGTPITLVRVVQPGDSADRFVAEADLVRRVSAARIHGLDVTHRVLESPEPGPEVLAAAAGGGVLVVGSHRRTGFDRVLHGSNALWLAHRAAVPVLVAGFATAAASVTTEEVAAIDLLPRRDPGPEPCMADLFGWAQLERR